VVWQTGHTAVLYPVTSRFGCSSCPVCQPDPCKSGSTSVQAEPVPDCDPLAGADQAVPGSGPGGPWRNREVAGVALAGIEWTNPSLIFRVGDVSRIANTREQISDELSFKWADLESDYWDTTVRGIRV